MEITTIDNRDAYKAREARIRYEQPYERYTAQTIAYFKRVTSGLKFQHRLRVEREVKRRIALEVRDV